MNKYLTLLLAVGLALTGCKTTGSGNADPASLLPRATIDWNVPDLIAVAYCGYFESESAFRESPISGYYSQLYGVPDAPIVTTEGDEWYFVLPRDPKAEISVSEYTFDMFSAQADPSSGKPIWKGKGAFFLKCNLSEVMGNTNIHVTGDGLTLDYIPSISLRDGSLNYPGIIQEGEGGVKDITELVYDWGLEQEAEIERSSVRITEDGSVVFTLKEALGPWESGDYPVEGLEGRCKGLFVGDIGQDFNPTVCMLMEDGGVEMLNYYASLGTDIGPGRFFSSGRLPDLQDIVLFKSGAVVDTVDGEKIPVYRTIFAVDKNGANHEIHECTRPTGLIHHMVEVDGINLDFRIEAYPDWTIKFVCGIVESELLEGYFGRLKPLKVDYETGIYEYAYDFLEHTVYEDLESDPTVEKVSVKGSFRLQEREDFNGFDFTPLTGDITFGLEPGTTEFFPYWIDDYPE
jgi:hypothetical protein